MSVKETIRAEIERRKIVYRSSDNLQDAIRYDEITELLSFLDTLPEQPVGDIDGKAMLYVADKSYKIGFRDGKASKEQSMEGLEEEIERYCGPYNTRPVPDFIETVARHFAEWGAEHLKR